MKLLTGPDNTADYTYLGTVFGDPGGRLTFRLTGKSRLPESAKSVQAFRWMLKRIVEMQSLEPAVLYHEGRCGACGRKLTVPESIRSGLGPVCGGRT